MEDRIVNIKIVRGNIVGYGLSVYVNDTRIAGMKPLTGGETVHEWEVPVEMLLEALEPPPLPIKEIK